MLAPRQRSVSTTRSMVERPLAEPAQLGIEKADVERRVVDDERVARR